MGTSCQGPIIPQTTLGIFTQDGIVRFVGVVLSLAELADMDGKSVFQRLLGSCEVEVLLEDP